MPPERIPVITVSGSTLIITDEIVLCRFCRHVCNHGCDFCVIESQDTEPRSAVPVHDLIFCTSLISCFPTCISSAFIMSAVTDFYHFSFSFLHHSSIVLVEHIHVNISINSWNFPLAGILPACTGRWTQSFLYRAVVVSRITSNPAIILLQCISQNVVVPIKIAINSNLITGFLDSGQK